MAKDGRVCFPRMAPFLLAGHVRELALAKNRLDHPGARRLGARSPRVIHTPRVSAPRHRCRLGMVRVLRCSCRTARGWRTARPILDKITALLDEANRIAAIEGMEPELYAGIFGLGRTLQPSGLSATPTETIPARSSTILSDLIDEPGEVELQRTTFLWGYRAGVIMRSDAFTGSRRAHHPEEGRQSARSRICHRSSRPRSELANAGRSLFGQRGGYILAR